MKSIFKHTALLLIIILYSTDLKCQLEYGQVIGLNLSELALRTADIRYHPEITPGIHFGGFIRLPVTDRLAFQPALIFTAKGSSYKSDSAFFSISPIYVEIPCNFFLTVGSGAVKLTMFAGPYFAFGVGGNVLDPGKPFRNIVFGNGENDDIRRYDLGVNAGAGVNISGFLLTAQYGTSLVNLWPGKAGNNELKNMVTGITLFLPLTAKK